MHTSTSDALRERRKEVGLSQSSLSHLAEITRGTVRNLESSAVDPDRRTLENVGLVLGLDTVDLLDDGDIVEVIPAKIVRRLLQIILQGSYPQDAYPKDIDRVAREAYLYRRLVAELTNTSDDEIHLARPMVEQFAELILPRVASVAVDQPLLLWFRDVGLDRTVALDLMGDKRRRVQDARAAYETLSSAPPGSIYLDNPSPVEDTVLSARISQAQNRIINMPAKLQEAAENFESLPLKMQRALENGRVVDFREVKIPGGVVMELIIKDDNEFAGAEFRQASTLWEAHHEKMAERWQGILDEKKAQEDGSTE